MNNEEDLFRKSLKVDVNSINPIGPKNPANNNGGNGDNSGGVAEGIAGHGMDTDSDRSFD